MGGPNISRIALIKEMTQGKIKLKAAGGIRTYHDFEALLHLGVERFGINAGSAVDIVSHYAVPQ